MLCHLRRPFSGYLVSKQRGLLGSRLKFRVIGIVSVISGRIYVAIEKIEVGCFRFIATLSVASGKSLGRFLECLHFFFAYIVVRVAEKLPMSNFVVIQIRKVCPKLSPEKMKITFVTIHLCFTPTLDVRVYFFL